MTARATNIRKRLSIIYSAIWAGILIIFTIGLFASFRYHLGVEIDDSLLSWSTSIVEAENSGRLPIPAGLSTEAAPTVTYFHMPDTFIVFFSESGELLMDRSRFSDRELQVLGRFSRSLPQSGEPFFDRLELGTQRYRVLGRRITDRTDAADHAIVLGRSLVHVEMTIQRHSISLALMLISAISVCSVVTWRLVGHTLKPIHLMTCQALTIADSEASGSRIEDRGSEDEFDELARALNRMLFSIESSHEALKRFLADASHEIRTPLTAIRANLDFLRMAKKAPESDRNAALKDCLASSDRMASLVNDLLALARADSPLPSGSAKLDLASIARMSAEEFLRRKDVPVRSFRLLLPERTAWVNGCDAELRQVFVILIDNAFKYTNPGGSVTLEVRAVGTTISVLLEDDGPGVPPDEIGSIFERFFRGTNIPNRSPGSGLGLAIARSIIIRHGGSISVSNRIPSGLSVEITLPATVT